MEGMVYPGIIGLGILLSFLSTWICVRKWIGKASEIGLLGWDMNKPSRPRIPEMGGVCVVFGFVVGLLVYIGLRTFYLKSIDYLPLLAALCTILMMTIIGIMDDLLGWKKGLKQWHKPVMTVFASMPMVVVNAGHSNMALPFIESIDWGIIYPLVLVPIGIVGASNAYNMVAGYNGLEAGMGAIMVLFLGYVALITGRTSVAAFALCMVGALLAFLYFNWYPAQVFPGDTLTYPVGAMVACIAILGDMEKIAVILFIPYVIDFFLVARRRFKAEAFAKVNADGSLDMPYDGIFHLAHLAIAVIKRMKSRVYERDIVLFVYSVEIIFVGVTWAAYLRH